MKLFYAIVGTILVCALGYVVFLKIPRSEPLGSVTRSNEYHATSTLNATAAGTYTIQSGAGVLGSVIIVSTTGATGFSVLDTDGTATTTIAQFAASPVVGTYTFDITFQRGLSIVVPSSFTGHFVTTYR